MSNLHNEPRIFLIGETRVLEHELQQFLEHIGAPEWKSDATTDPEKLIEVYGRTCYRSFAPELNPNIKKIRTSSLDHIQNLVNSGHGSVLEHAQTNWVFTGVSRVFTHELVRHRVGVGISQESLRYVRLTELQAWLPTVIAEDTHGIEIFSETFEFLEEQQKRLAEHFGIDKMNFRKKKIYTSAFRRIAPIGLSTTIGWSANFRTLRFVIEKRTHPSSEEEIRLVFSQVAQRAIKTWPIAFADYQMEIVDGIPWFHTGNPKV